MSGMRERSPAGSNPADLRLTIPLPPLPHSAGSGGLRPDADLRSQCWPLVNVVRSAGAPWTHPGNRNCGIYNDNLLVRTSTADFRSCSEATEKQIQRQAFALGQTGPQINWTLWRVAHPFAEGEGVAGALPSVFLRVGPFLFLPLFLSLVSVQSIASIWIAAVDRPW